MLCSKLCVPVFKNLSIIGTKRFCSSSQFETVFSFPSIKYIALLNRLKVYHLFGSGIIAPTCGALEVANIIPEYAFFTAAYIGITGAAVLSLASLPFRNVIGFLYISEDDKLIKISSVDFWGNRKDRIVQSENWIPLLTQEPKKMDPIYLTPELTDGTKYKLFVKFGIVLNSKKIGEVLE